MSLWTTKHSAAVLQCTNFTNGNSLFTNCYETPSLFKTFSASWRYSHEQNWKHSCSSRSYILVGRDDIRKISKIYGMLDGDSAMEKNKGINGIQGVHWG